MQSSLITSNKHKVFDALLKQKGIIVRQTETISRCEKADAYPLSFAQQRLWFLDQLEPGKALYSLPAAVRLSGQLDTSALSRSFDEVVRRHESLRTTFKSVDGQPRQVIAEPGALPLPLIDLTGLGVSERQAEVACLVGEEARRPFDLAAGPLLRAKLLRLGNDEHVLLLNMHHIISDGWSLGVLVRELTKLYAGYAAGREPQLPELPIQYADYVVWQQRWLQGPTLEEQLSYWRKQLAGIPSALELPTDRPRPAEQSYRGASTSLSLPESITQELRRLARTEDVTLFMLLSAAFKLLLHRYTNQTDIVVGTPIANRKRAELEGLIGFFVNTLVLRTDLSGDPTFHELLAREREVCLGAYANQDAPFERLVEELQPDRSSGHSPLFQVAFILQNTPAEQLSSEVDGLRVSRIGGAATQTAKFDLTLTIEEGNRGLSAAMEFSTELFDVSTVDRMAGHFVRLLESILSDPGCPISRLELLTDLERRQVLFDFNDLVADYPRESCLQELFEAQVEHTPEAVALIYQNEQLTYRELNERANRLARYLLARGVESDTLVGLQLSRSVDMVVALLGVIKAGGVYVALDPAYPPTRLRFMLDDAQIGVLLTTEQLQPREVPLGVEVISLDTEGERIASESPHNPACHAAPDNLAYVAYTSGSTGTPKGVAVPQRAVIRLVKGANYVELGADEVMFQYAPLAFDASTFEVWGSLLNGARLVIASGGVLSIEELGRVIREQRVTTLWLTAGLFHQMVDQRLEDLRGVRQLLAGGDVLSVAHVIAVMRELPDCRLINGYGPTENTTFTCCHAVTEESGLHRSVPIGQAIPGTQVYLLDSNLRPVPVGVAGELYVGGDGLARGYLNRPELTAQRFIPHPFNTRGERLYRTGDVARYLPNGVVEFLGRADLQIKLRGFRIELGEIEAVLNTHEAVQSAVVVAREVEADEKILVAYVVAQPSQSPSTSEWYVYLRERLPEYMVPQAFVMLEELPLMPNGKVDRHKLPAPEQSPTLAREYIAPRTPVEEILAAIWGGVLGRKTVSVHDNFFELGGHSLLATQVISRVRDAFGQDVALRSLFEQPTVAGLAQTIERAQRAEGGLSAPPLVPVSRDAELPLSFAQQRLWFLDQLGPGSVAYNIPSAVRLKGRLDVEALQRTLDEVVRRHEVLRTTFVGVNGEAVQVIAPPSRLELPVMDLSELPEEQREAKAHQLAAAEAAQPFDLSVGPLLRVQLLRLGEEDHVVLFTMHHIITDGWSMGILVNEVSVLYEAYIEGRESPLPELEIEYADYAVWQREWLQGEVLEQQLSYWRQQLGEELPVLQLRTDKPRPPVQSYRGRSLGVSLPAELTAELKKLSNTEGVTLYMTLLAAFKILLWRYSGQSDVVVGTPIAGRNHLATEGLIGLFVNTLVLRTSLSGDPSFRELLDRVREVTLGAYAHQDLPFEKLVEELQPERDMSRSPLAQVVFALHNETRETLQLPELQAKQVGGAADETAKFDITMGLTEINGELSGSLQYSTDLFEASTISRMLEQFERLLASAISAPEQHISKLELLSSAERQQLLVEWNETHVAYPHNRGIHELFEDQVALAPDAPALTFQREHLSYAELNSRANQLAHYLRQVGVKADIPIGVCLHRSVEMIVALLAILKAGGTYVPLDPEYPAERLAFIVEDVFPPVILTDSSLVDDMPSSWAQTLCLDTESELWSALPTSDLADLVSSSDNLAYVMYTSGSTGNPKGVAVPHRAVVRLVKQSSYVDFGPSEVFLQLAPVTFDASTLEIWGALLNGGRLVLMPPGAPNLAELGTVLRSEGVTVLWLTAGLFHLMVEQELEALAGVTQVVAGGDVLSVEHVRRLLRAKEGHGVVVNGYGPTETTTFACCYRMNGETELEDGVPIGSPIGNTQVYVLGQAMELMGQGMLGELYIGGPGLARGYYNQPELTADRFVPHPFSATGDERLYRTGDYVSWRADGTLEFIGRRDTQVKIRGFRVEPGEVEAVLGRHGAVKECAVVVRRETNGEKRLVAYVVDGNHEDGVNASELRDYLREQLPEFMLPGAIVAIESLPLTPNGKVDRRELAAREVHVGGDQSYVPPRTINEELLCNIWEEVLHVERVGIDDNFFDQGGDSILTIQVIAKANAVGLHLSVQQLFQYQTVYELAQELERSNESSIVEETAPFSLIGEEDRLRLPAGVVDAYPVTALQAGMLFHSELAPEAGQYHDIFSYHLRMPFDEAALQDALRQLLELHPVLRTSFNLSDFSEPLQLVHEEVEVPLRIEDLRSLTSTEQEEYVAEWVAAEKRYHFDWRMAPLLRFQIARRDEESFQFSLSFHHAILDGWSHATMLTELFNVYASVLQGDEHRTHTPLSSSFRDFVAAEQTALNSAEAQQYWTTMLSDAPHSRLPRLGQSAGPSRVAGHSVDISSELSLALKALARTAGVPLKSVLLAAHLRILSVLTGSRDVLTGMASHGRPETADGERVLGLFLNMLPFARRLAGGTWLELVQETFAAERESLPFRRYPMARMQQDLGNDAPLFEVIFNFVHFHVYEELQHVSGVEVLGFAGVADTNFPLSVNFSLELAGSQIRLDLNYAVAELSEQIEAIGGYYERALLALATNPHEQYDSCQLLSESELRRQLEDWNHPTLSFPHTRCIPQLFAEQVAATPQAVALEFGNQRFTYAQLNERANQLARHLISKGVGRESVVGIAMERSPDMIVSLLGVLKAGGVYLPLDPDYPRERLVFMLEDAAVRIVLTHRALCHRLPQNEADVICLDKAWTEIATSSKEDPERRVSSDNLAYITYTSGSTGQPKGVQIPHRGVVRLVRENDYAHLGPDEACLQFAPLAFDASTFEIWGMLLNGGRLVIMPPGPTPLAELGQVLKTHHVTVLWLTAGLFNLMVDEQLDDLRGLRQLLAGGDALSVSHVERFLREAPGCKLINGYGPTENTTFTCCYSINTEAEFSHSVPIGRPIANTQVYILDENLRLVATGARGELYTGGDGLARGYLNHPELTAERFVPHPFSAQPGARLYRTGDWARYLPGGDIEFLGRVDNQAKIRGFRIEPGEIEAVLRGHQQVREAVVVLKEADGDKRLVAYVVSDAQAGELREYLKEQLPDYMVPSFFVHLDEIPLTPHGKLNRHALPAPESMVVAEAEYEAPRTPTEELLAGLWASVLRVSRVGINDNFFELGGHSLLATQVIARVRDAFGQEVALRSLFEQPTVADLAQTIEIARLAGAGLSAPALVPIAREVELPLSFAQQRLWFLDQLEASGSFYNLAAAVRFRGVLNVEALERTLSEIIRRHEALRTSFVAVDGKPRQVIKPFTPLSLPVFDVSKMDPAEREAETRRLLSEETSRPFDLARGPLVRTCLVRLGAEEHAALVTMHHIISDGWSMGILIREVAALYGAYVRGEESSLEELPVQYADFAHWQRGWLQGEVLTAQLDYWREALAELPTMLELPTDRPRPREQSFNGAAVRVELPAELTGQLKALSQRERVTLFMTLLAAFQTLLFRHSGQDDIVVGTPIANRRYRELEDLIGFFVNTLALRARSLQTLTFSGLLQRVREVTLGAYAHQDLPFEKLVEELQPERDLSRNPLFQVMFALQNAPASVLKLPGLTLEGQRLESHTTRFDLECHLQENGEVLGGVFVYNTDLFDEMMIERLVVNFATLLQSIAANPGEAVASLRLLRAEDEQQLLYGWNETSTAYPPGVVQELFAQQVERTPHETAVVFEDAWLTFLELNQRSNQLAKYLQSKGVGADTVVGVMLERSVEMLVGVLGVLKAGGAYLPLDPEYPAERLQFMLADAQVSVLLTQDQLADNIGANVEVIRLDTDWHDIVEQAVDEAPRAKVTSDNLAYVIYTSGSTGKPKGVAMTHRVLVNLLHWQMRRSANAPRTLQFTSLSFDVSFQEIFATWCAGGTLVLMREEARRDAGELWRLLIRERIERLFLPFVALQYLAEAAEHNEEYPATLREVITAGEQLKITRHIRSLFAKLDGCTLDNQYGPSETHVVSALMLTGDAADWPELPAIGRPIANAQLYLLDERLQVVPIGAAGELYIGGEVVARGYLNRAAVSAEKFLPHPFIADSRLYRTGDQARYLADGNIEFLGRRDQQVKVRGYRIELGEVEAALRQQPQVREAVVIISPTASGENRLIAYVLTEPETTLTTTALRGGLRELLPEYMIPAAFVLLAEFPLTASGKIDRRALQARQVEFEAGESMLARTPAEEIVAAIWAEVLGRETIGVHDNFFELGGHSLLATQVISRVRDAFSQEVALRSLFERPTVAGLVQSIEQQQRTGAGLLAPPLMRIREAERLPLSFAQQRLWFLDQMEPGNSSYNIPAAVRLRGVLNIEVLEQTLSEVVRRHEVLRTRFIAVDGEPVQVIDAAAPLRLEVLDLSGLDDEARESDMLRMVRMEASLPFDLSRGPLLRVSLIRLHAEDHVAAVTMPHIVTDGWSTAIFINEVATLYAAYLHGDESPLEELPIQYADFAHWQRGWLQGEVLAAQLDYWRAELADAPTVIDLPIDKPRPPVQTYRGAYQPLQLSTELSAQLRDLSRSHGSTLFMTLLAAFDLLLCRYAGQEQVLVGSPIANRNRSETEGLIGFFVNTLVLRGDVRGNPSFRELLWRVREASLGAYAHQDLPFEKLVEELQPERDMSRSPLFQVTFTLQNAPSEGLELEGLSLSRVESAGDTVKFEVSLAVEERGGAIMGAMAYNRDLFEARTIERLMASYERVLQAVVADAEQRVLEIDLLSEAERQQILEGWNETRREHRGAVTLHQLFKAQVARSGGAVALVFEGEQLSYAELDRRSNQLAHHLVSLGVSPDSLVAVCLDRSFELFIALLGILKAGAAYLPLDFSYPLARLSFMLADAGSPLLLTTEALADELPIQWTPPVLLDTDWDVIALNTDEALPETVVAADQLAYVMYTSGSTGTPKGVAVTHGGVARLVTSPNYVRLDLDQTLLQLAPLTFDASTLEVWGALLNGGRLVVMPPNAPTLDEISRVIVEEGVTTLWLTAGLFHLMVDEQLECLSQVKQLLAGGDVLSVRHVEKYLSVISNSDRRLINGYGPTENTTFTCCHVMDQHTRLNGSVPIGCPITNTQVYVLDAEMQVVPLGVVGELYIGGAGLARGYFDQPELTAEMFVPHPHSTEAGARLYRTGDMVRWHESGELEFVGRVDGQVKIRGFRIEVGEIEAVLAVHQGVREAVVLVREDERGDKRLAAYVLKEAESEVSAGQLKEYLRERLPEYMQVQWVVEVQEMPLTPNGKIDRRALQLIEVELASSESVLARTPAEEILSAIWAEVLGRETVSVHDNFFELGGHSLLATQVISRVRDAFGQEVALRSLFEQPTVAGLASEIEASRGLELQAPPLVRVERAARLPLSFAQQRLWFLDQLEPGSSFYNIPAAMRLHGVLNVEALERTLSEVVRRHEVLRTHFIAIDGEPVQVIEPAAPIKLEVLDLSALNEAERAATTERLVAEESARPFDLTTGPLLRVSLLRLGAEEHVALVMIHHIISDGWSIGVLVREVAAFYGAYVRSEEPTLEELPIQYADFAHWQRNWLQGEVLAAQLDYWRAELADAPTLIDLPIDKPRPPVQTYRGAHHPLQLSVELSAQLRDLSRRHSSTLFMTLLAAFDLLLCRYAGQEQVLVGSPIANRNRSETEALIGFFVNTLVLRGDVRGNPTFRELLLRVRETALGAYAHQDLPFEKLVEELQPERDMSRSPLFQVMFVLQNAPGEALQLEGLTLSGVGSASETAKFELMLGLEEVGGMVAGGLNYNRDLYEAESIERMAASYERVLQAIVTDAGQPVFEIDLLSETERRQIIEGWNQPQREYAPSLTLSDLFEAQAARTPDAVALLLENTALSYRELNGRANQLAHYLQRRGVGPEVLVGILMHRSIEMLVAVLGILKAGGAYVPLDPSYPLERLAFMVQDSGMRMLLTQERLNEVPGEYTGETLSLTEQWDSIAGESIENVDRSAQPENVAYVIYTSGSTGQPKGVLISHENVMRLLEATQPHFEFNQNDVWTLFHSYAFDFSVWEIWGALAYGGKLVVVPYWISRSAEAFHRLLVSEQVTVLNQTPSAFRQLMAADESAGDGVELKLRLVIFGGEALELQSLRPWFACHGDHTPRLVNMFGITETTVHVTYRPLTAVDLELASSSVIGRPLECLQVYLLDERGQPVPIGVAAEVCVGGTGLARGYLNRAGLTAERFVPNPFSTSPGARLYKSGDLARFLPNGDIDYLGRIDQQVKVRGFRIELGEIEAALAEHEAVRECTVVASADVNGETKLLAYLVVGRQQPAPSVTALREFLQQKLPEYMIPASFLVLDAMPLTPNGKIDRKALPAPDQARPEMGKEFIAPRTPAEQIVAGIWEELLDIRPVGVRDDFFSLGGHSLLAVRLMARIQASFGQHLPLASLFQGATIEKLASLLHEQPHDHGASALVGIQPNGDGLPFFCVHPGGGNVLCYNELSNHLGFEWPFYGLQARGLAENQIPHTRIEDMAAYYIDAIRTVRPDGPYLLGGWSMGGVIAYEMAQQLEARGQQVSLLALMDARPVTAVDDAAPLDELTLLTNFARDLGLPVDGLQLSTDELAKLDSDELLSCVLQRAIEAGVVPGDIQLAHARRLFEVFKINVQAMQSYRPEASSTHVTLLTAGEQEVADETMGWGALTSGEIEIHRVPGSHFTIVREPYVRSLAEQLADCINRATLRSLASHT